MKKILIIKGHPREISFCNALVDQYIEGAKTNDDVEIRILTLKELELEPWLKYGWDRNRESIPLSEGLKRAKELIMWSEHLVFAYPTYWAAPPALVTLFIEVIITSGFAFKYHKPLWGMIPQWDRLLTGRTATIIATMDAPLVFVHFYEQDPGGKMMRDVLRFTGVKLKHKYYFGSVVLSSEERKKKWLTKAYRVGKRDNR